MRNIFKSTLIIYLFLSYFISLNVGAIPSAEKGWYVGGNVGIAGLNNTDYGQNSSTHGSGFGFNFNVGYKFIPYFGLETGYSNYATTDIRAYQSTVAQTQPYSLNLAAKAILPMPLTEFELFLKLGYAWVSENFTTFDQATINTYNLSVPSGRKTSSDYFYGLGAEHYFTKQTSIILLWTEAYNPSGVTGTLDLYTIGINHIFS